ncbi:MAG: maltose alpha-D-glucosyltransferase [Caldilineaceae bacterium]|nr:maltose alpha-D-glucosyltransferase [Caldilineaceae bacterium]
MHAVELQWLLDHSMLAQAKTIAARFAGQGRMWQHPYAHAQPRAAAARASVWFTAYPAAVISREGESVLQTLGNETLWRAFQTIGIQALHTGPMKIAGGITENNAASEQSGEQPWHFTPTIDGFFDRIGLALDPAFGTAEQFVAMSHMAAQHGALIIDDIVPGHTGKGADFRLAERHYADYPGLYHMVEIPPADWELLPPVPTGKDAVNLLPATVELLKEKGYLVGQLTRVIFYEPGVKETDWSATPPIRGVDGIERRWVYLHYFKAGQPTLNWLDPSFAAPRLVLGDALHALDTLGAGMLRLDANGFLGIERRTQGPAWSEGHPLSLVANQLIAGLVRKVGGFTFQELNLTVDDIATMSNGGADLAYDFITRPAYHHALVTGDTAFLRLMLTIMHESGVDPASLVHALQNHDELTLELVHFWTLHREDDFVFQGARQKGWALREQIRQEMYARLTGANAPYNLRFVTNGVACTTASAIAAALGITDLTNLTATEKAQIQQVHLLLAMYNALQPGVFALSGWDLVGALPLEPALIAPLLAEGDTRWINRGAYDLIDANPQATASAAGLPRATMLYGPLTTQLQQPDSFANQLRHLLAVRQQYQIYASRQLAILQPQAKALLVMVHELPDQRGRQVTALNFGPTPIEETVVIPGFAGGTVTEMLTGETWVQTTPDESLVLHLPGFTGKAYWLPQT